MDAYMHWLIDWYIESNQRDLVKGGFVLLNIGGGFVWGGFCPGVLSYTQDEHI